MTPTLPPGNADHTLTAGEPQKLLPEPGTPGHEFLLDVATNEGIQAVLAQDGFRDDEDDYVSGE